MRSHVKAASAGSSTRRRANGPGGIDRGAFVGREGALDAKGSGAPFFGLTLICLLALSLLLAPSADAATVTQRPVLFTIDGADVPDHPMVGGTKVAVDNVTGAVYFSEGDGKNGEGRVFRYHADGTPWPFTSSGLPYLSLPGQSTLINVGVAVDNSGGPNQSRIYTAGGFDNKLRAFDPSGELLWSTNQPNPDGDVAVDLTGHPYVSSSSMMVRKYDNSGSPPALIQSIPMIGARAIDVNTAGDLFLGISSIEKWGGGSFSSALDSQANDVYVNQSSPTGSIFTTYVGRDERQDIFIDATAGQFRLSFGGAQTPDLPYTSDPTQMEQQIRAALQALPTIGVGNAAAGFAGPGTNQATFRGLFEKTDVEQITCQDGTTPLSGGPGCSVSTVAEGISSDAQEYDSDGTLLATFGEGALASATGVAYNPSLDRLYVLEGTGGQGTPSVVAFGPSATGTVGDATIDAPSAIGVATAHFSGTVNPQGTTSEWRFQWRKGGQSWNSAPASPPQPLPADSIDHTVESTTIALRGDTTYQVRLVAVNTANQLVGVSLPTTFTTTKAAQAPTVTIAAPSAFTADGATISGTVNPQGDTADWRVQTSTDPACATGFTDQPLQEVSPSGSSPVDVQYEVTGLFPSQRYCARIIATNSAGSATSEAKEFETFDVLPTQVFAAFAAPRTDTRARLNGYVNPEGDDATYRFEYSANGSTWTSLPDMQTPEKRRQIVVASELSGLQPATIYHYRFTIENNAGSVQSDEKTFETRTTAEMELPQRGIELVNQPNKGNQNISIESPNGDPSLVRPDGNKVIWNVNAGVPSGNTGASVGFLSTRTAIGWKSQPLAPPADQQVGGGAYAYRLNAATPDFGTFLMRVQQSGAQGNGPPTFVRISDQYQQEILTAFSPTTIGLNYENADMTSDGAHVVTANPETDQIEEIGSQPHEIVSILPDGQPAECGVPSSGFYGVGGAGGSPSAVQWRSSYHRMAITDASRLYFQALPNGGSCTEGPGHRLALYYRNRSAGQTVEIDPGTAPLSPALVRATPDGRSVIFVTQTAHSPEDENFTGDVYRWDSEGSSYTCLTCVVDEAALSLESGNKGYDSVRVSDDFSHVYFTSERQLVPGHGMPGEASVYSLSNAEVKYVASGRNLLGDLLGGAMLSRDGNVLVFRSNHGQYSQFTADEHADECMLLVTGQNQPNCQALFRYEASTNSLECLSCLPGGVTTHDVGELNKSAAVSADGSTVAFVTHERVLPEDINNAEDVYEWRNGALQLITDGETAYPSTGIGTVPRVYGIDAEGENIFFTVVQPGLTGYEQDGLSNLYDARIGGGFSRPTETPHCSEESCQGPLTAPPPEQRIGSSGLAGAGNEATSAKKGRCMGKRGKAKSRCLHPKKRKKHKKRSAKQGNSQRSDRGAK